MSSELNRLQLIEELDARQDEVLEQLALLEAQLERTLERINAGAAPAAAAPAALPPAAAEPRRRAPRRAA